MRIYQYNEVGYVRETKTIIKFDKELESFFDKFSGFFETLGKENAIGLSAPTKKKEK